MSIPTHMRANHERTSQSLHEVRSMMLALENMAEAANPKSSPESESLFSLISVVQRMLQETDDLHTAEWVGMGGSSQRLSAEQIAAARGENNAKKVAA